MSVATDATTAAFASATTKKLTKSDFDAKPMVMLLGQYSTGKTTFIKHLLKCNYPAGNFPLKALKKLSLMPTKRVTGCIHNVSLIDDASYLWRLCQIRFINQEVLSKMESISEDTTIADRKQILITLNLHLKHVQAGRRQYIYLTSESGLNPQGAM
ncbi:hypothetical protein CQW23_06047 [Capsicum baccatum]|uniref:EH domain-containing protein 1 n=1 Tax=Capsicum baccatum TaxID=33114 RepID=A0A2G2X281_CAPBA|nr:hypothetical protein CQW23_06047 [Capsicum baccatum]